MPGENDFKLLTISHLKTYLNGEHESFKNAARKAVLDRHEVAIENQFY